MEVPVDYVPGPEEPKHASLSLDYVPEYPKYLAPYHIEVPIEDQPLPADASPTSLSSGYVFYSDPEEDPEEDHADGGDDDDDDESSEDDADDEDEEEIAKEEDDDEEEEEHLASADSSVVPVVDHVPSAKDTEAFETDEFAPTPPSPRPRRVRISVRFEPPMAAFMEARIAEYAVAPTLLLPPLSPLTPLSSPLPQIPSPSLPPTHTSPTYVEAPLGYKEAMIRSRDASPFTRHLSEIPSPPLLLPSTTHRDDLPEADMPLQKRALFIALTGRFEVGESSSTAVARQAGHTLAYRVDYGFVDTMDASICASESEAMTAEGDVHERVTDIATTQRQETQELYVGCEDAQDDRALLRAQKILPNKRTTTTPMTDVTIKAVNAQGVTDALAEIKANKTSRNGDNSRDSGTGSRRTEQLLVATAPSSTISSLLLALFLAVLYRGGIPMMFPKESDDVERYIGGLHDMIQGSVMASKPKTMQDSIKFTTELMDQKIRSFADRQAENKRKLDETLKNNQNQQQPFKMHNVARAYTAGPGKRKCTGDLNLCALNATTITMGSVLLSAPTIRGLAIWPGTVEASLDFLKLENKNKGNQAGKGTVVARAYVVGTTGINSNSNVVTVTFLLNNRYSLILFDTGVDRSFVSTAFSSLFDIIPTTLDHGYDVELADEIGSFDVIIGMDWLSKYHVVIVCNKKIVRVPFGK
nr:hypothetical protein [Tanacetum cinerariifolium]